MPKETIHIKGFHAGLWGGVDERDIPLDGFAYSENLSPAAIQGKLSGIETDSEVVSDSAYDAAVTAASGGAGNVSISANYKDGSTVVLLDTTGTNTIVEIEDINTTPSISEEATALTISGTPKAMVSDGSAIHIGMGASSSATPRWIGDIDYGQFEQTLPLTPPNVEVANLKYLDAAGHVALTTTGDTDATTADETLLEEDSAVFYYVVAEYDGFQEGPLYWDRTANLAFGPISASGFGLSEVALRLTVNEQAAAWNARISAFHIYRGVSATGLAWRSDTEPVHVRTIDINDTAWSGSTGAYIFNFTDDVAGGSSYSDRTGVAATQRDMDMYWGLSCGSEQYHFIANVVTDVGGETFQGAERALFRSQPYKFDMWDKTEFVLLPHTPNAIAAMGGRVFVFSDNETWVVDAATLDITDRITGIGCFGPDSVVVTDRGMLFCDARNIYVTDVQGRITPIGNPVLKNDVDSDAAYLSRSTATDPVVVYDARYDAYVILYVNASGTVSYLMYRPQQAQTIDLPQGRWDHVKTSYTALGTRIAGNRTRPMVVLDGDIMELFGSATKRAWTATLREMETPEYAKYYDADILGDQVTLEYSEDGGAFATTSTAAYGSGAYRGEVNSRTGRAWTRVHTHQLRLTGTADQEVDSLAINRRRMVRA